MSAVSRYSAVPFAGAVALMAACGGASTTPDLADVVDAVSRPHTVFVVECASTVNGEQQSRVRQWFAPDLHAIRTETVSGVSVLTDTDDVERNVSTGQPVAHHPATPFPPIARSRAAAGLVHVGSLADLNNLKFESGSENGVPFIRATGSRVRSPDEAGEDEPAGDPQTMIWKLNAESLFPVSAHFEEHLTDGTLLFATDVACSQAARIDAAKVDASLFDPANLEPSASFP